MESVVQEMFEELIMLEAASKYFALAGQETEAQDVVFYYNHMKDAKRCKYGAAACKQFFQTKDISVLIKEFKRLGLRDNVNRLKELGKN